MSYVLHRTGRVAHEGCGCQRCHSCDAPPSSECVIRCSGPTWLSWPRFPPSRTCGHATSAASPALALPWHALHATKAQRKTSTTPFPEPPCSGRCLCPPPLTTMRRTPTPAPESVESWSSSRRGCRRGDGSPAEEAGAACTPGESAAGVPCAAPSVAAPGETEPSSATQSWLPRLSISLGLALPAKALPRGRLSRACATPRGVDVPGPGPADGAGTAAPRTRTLMPSLSHSAAAEPRGAVAHLPARIPSRPFSPLLRFPRTFDLVLDGPVRLPVLCHPRRLAIPPCWAKGVAVSAGHACATLQPSLNAGPGPPDGVRPPVPHAVVLTNSPASARPEETPPKSRLAPCTRGLVPD